MSSWIIRLIIWLLDNQLAQLIDSENAQKLGLNRELLALVRSPQDLNTNRARKNQQIIMAHILRAIKVLLLQLYPITPTSIQFRNIDQV